MTGLDVDSDQIISLCCFITDAQLNLLDSNGWEAVIHLDQSTLDAMGEWCRETHGKSGLTAASLASTTTAEEAADRLLEYVEKHVSRSRTGLLAGNSVHADKAFLRKSPFSKVVNYLHYRIFDVSAIQEAARRWAPQSVLDGLPLKEGRHEARADILESVAEAKYYQEVFFKHKSFVR